jgi:septum formation protein
MSKLLTNQIILASASARRQELLHKHGIQFDILITDANEEVEFQISPADFVTLIAKRKLDAAIEKIALKEFKVDAGREAVIIAADTIVAIDDKILGKPKDLEEAFEMLKLLQGRDHEGYTGLAIYIEDKSENKIIQDYCCTRVYMKALADQEIINYINIENPLDKAGSYAIQGKAAEFIEKIEGDYNNVVGLPMELLIKIIESNTEIQLKS